MFDDGPDRGPPTSLRGWLSDIYMPVLLDDERSVPALMQRLGTRATIDDPVFGRASGLPALESFVREQARWLKAHGAVYERTHFTTGVDRDVTEGVIAISFEEKMVELPVAVVAERRKSREVELRLYYSTQPIKGTYAIRSPLVAEDKELILPVGVQDHVDALSRGDVAAIVAGFETDGAVREARGLQHKKGNGLREFYEALFAGSPDGVHVLKGGVADDGRTCALEFTLVRMNGRDVPPQAGLAVYERGDSGLLRAVRIYDDLEL